MDRKAVEMRGRSKRMIRKNASFLSGPLSLTNSFALLNLSNSIEDGFSRSTTHPKRTYGSLNRTTVARGPNPLRATILGSLTLTAPPT